MTIAEMILLANFIALFLILLSLVGIKRCLDLGLSMIAVYLAENGKLGDENDTGES